MNKICLSSVFCLLSFATVRADALTNCLTYAATFGKVSSGNEVETCAVNGAVEMTVTLYSSQTSQEPLWCRHVTNDVVDGAFAAILSDDAGADVRRDDTRYARLADLFAGEKVSAAFWVELSDVLQNGAPLPDAALATLARGRITGAPFAVIAERAEQSLGSFTVRGKATVTVLVANDELTVTGRTDFASTATFDSTANFAGDLLVTGLVTKSTLDDIGTFATESLSVTKTLAVGTLSVTNGAATSLKPSDGGFVAPRDISVSGTFACGGGVEANEAVLASALETTGAFTIPADGTLDWAAGGTLLVPDGVYKAECAVSGVYSSSETSVNNGSSKNAFLSLSLGAYRGAYGVKINDGEWACFGPYTTDDTGAGVNVTTLTPLAPRDTAKANWILTRDLKELKK